MVTYIAIFSENHRFSHLKRENAEVFRARRRKNGQKWLFSPGNFSAPDYLKPIKIHQISFQCIQNGLISTKYKVNNKKTPKVWVQGKIS